MNKELIKSVQTAYESSFGGVPLLVRAPGRINVIGEHTDYNDGFVLPAAVGQAIYFAVGLSGNEDSCTLISLDQDERFEFRISELRPGPANSWQNYLLGVVWEILKSGREVKGFNLVFSGDIPQGSGMSSSAALECGTCFALDELFALGIPKVEMVKMSQMAEHNYAGVKCGIMDQFASMMGQVDQVLLLDCRSLEYTLFPMELVDYTLMLCNSNVSHNLASSEYNVRRGQCEEGVASIKTRYSEVTTLRDVSLDMLSSCREELSEVVYRRCKYVIEENERVHEVIASLKHGDIEQVGVILKAAHHAMKHEYEITCIEIDFMADFANGRPDILGCRMMGGGFGGCTINLVKKGHESLFVSEMNAAYQARFGKEITPIEIQIANGVGLVQPL